MVDDASAPHATSHAPYHESVGAKENQRKAQPGPELGTAPKQELEDVYSRHKASFPPKHGFFIVASWKTVRANMTDDELRTNITAAWVRDGLLNLGPTMIKLGQVFSSRKDLLHPAVPV